MATKLPRYELVICLINIRKYTHICANKMSRLHIIFGVTLLAFAASSPFSALFCSFDCHCSIEGSYTQRGFMCGMIKPPDNPTNKNPLPLQKTPAAARLP